MVRPVDASESTPLLRESSSRPSTPTTSTGNVNIRLYVSHFLSTWNSRVFEFGAVLFLASIFPGSLLPMSLYALLRGLSAVLFSSAIGRYIDIWDRLYCVRISIVLQRLAVAASCVLFWLLNGSVLDWTTQSRAGALVLLSLLACVEKLGSIMNLVAVEKDWVVVIAGDDEPHLSNLNAQMRRIDLLCKLVGPFAVSSIYSYSAGVAILVVLGQNLVSIPFEYFAIAKVYGLVPGLHVAKSAVTAPVANDVPEEPEVQYRLTRIYASIKRGTTATLKDHGAYFRHVAFLPSFSGALLYFTVLSFGGQMVTYLLNAGYAPLQIAAAQMLAVGLELAATSAAPLVMSRIGVIRAGMWLGSWQLLCLTAGTTCFFLLRPEFVAASALVGGTILSRVGLRGFDLVTQIIVQQEVEAERRGAFSSVEAAWQNAFELCSFASTLVFAAPDQFRWPATISCATTFAAWVLYAVHVRKRRGHLLHLPSSCMEKRRSHNRDRGDPAMLA